MRSNVWARWFNYEALIVFLGNIVNLYINHNTFIEKNSNQIWLKQDNLIAHFYVGFILMVLFRKTVRTAWIKYPAQGK